MNQIKKAKLNKFFYHFYKMFYLIFSWVLIAIGLFLVYTVPKATREYLFFYGILTGVFLLFTMLLLVFVEFKEIKK